MHCFKLIIFDLDGTLLDTVEEIADSMNDMLSEFDFPNVTLDQAKHWVGKGAPHFLNQVIEYNKLNVDISYDELLQRFYHHYERRSGTGSSLYPGVQEALDTLYKSGYKLSVVTNKFKRGADKVLQSHNIDHLFDDIIGGDSFEQKKPDPIAVHYLMKKHGVQPEHVLFIGDSTTDVSTAKNAGVDVWAVPYGYNHGQPIELANPNRVMTSFTDVLDILSAGQIP